MVVARKLDNWTQIPSTKLILGRPHVPGAARNPPLVDRAAHASIQSFHLGKIRMKNRKRCVQIFNFSSSLKVGCALTITKNKT